MKTIILFFLLTFNLLAQSSTMLLLFDGGYKNAETTLYLSGLTTPITPTYAATLDSFITKVKDSLSITSLSQKFDVMYDLGGYNQEQSLRNMVKRSHDATAVNSPTFTQWQGFTGDGSSKYLNTNYNPSTDTVNVKYLSNSLGVYSRTAISQGTQRTDIGIQFSSPSACYFMIVPTWNTGNGFYAGGLTTNFLSDTITVGGQGLWTKTKSGSNDILYINSSVRKTGSLTSAAYKPNGDIFILARNLNGIPIQYSNRQLSFAFIGAGLTATEVRQLTNCVEWLMDRKGTGVIP